ncbi:hypothetical protein [Luteibacter aegosomatissinici]|uniref:hypothetical protein n=1 Tax=Luteibacter aegosomatissinici TaxID=2911539 RepID=UPI001FF9328E|nr:hypothetical protein [Luteibacter aegosomatissinici]UPG93696.1 hypothetical protein L2Y97_17905 [Luteibacter aegosomatissinici]
MSLGRCLLFAAIATIAACSDTHRYAFAGARGAFCVPDAYAIEAPLWLTSDIAEDDGGFAFRGCGSTYKGDCAVPANVAAGTVGPLDSVSRRTWADWQRGGGRYDSMVASLARHDYRVYPDGDDPAGRILAIADRSRGTTATAYWRIGAEGEPALDSASVVLAECDGVKETQVGDSGEVAFACSRDLREGAMQVRYDFYNGVISSRFVEATDRKVLAGIARWRCGDAGGEGHAS